MKYHDFSGINPDSLPPTNRPDAQTPSQQGVGSEVALPINQPAPQFSPDSNLAVETHSRFGFFKKKVFLLVFFLLFLVAGSAGAAYFYFNSKVTNYTLVPEDTNFYLALSVKKHPQVQKLLELGKMMPGGEKMIKYLDDHRSELLGTRKDPFKNILDLADTEVFLAKISSDAPPVTIDSGRTINGPSSTLEHLVNIVEFKNSSSENDAFKKLQDDSNITLTNEAYGSAQIAKLELKSQNQNETTDKFSTGPLPYQVTLPLSKSIFATSINKYLVAAEEQGDVKKVIDLATNAKDKKLKSLADDSDHQEISGHFPKDYLLKFYMKQDLSPFSNLGPGTTLPVVGQNYDTRQRASTGDNVFTTKRGLTIVAQDNGIDLTSYQLTKKSKISEELKHAFTMDSSLANRLPSVFNSTSPFIYAEAKNIKEAIADQMDQLDDVAKNSSDERQKKLFEDAKKSIEDAKKTFREEFGIDADDDLLSWMDGNAAMIFTAGSSIKAPELLFVFDVKDAKDVETKLSKIRIPDMVGNRPKLARDAARKSDVGQLASGLQGYYVSRGAAGQYPKTFDDLAKDGDLKRIPTDPNGDSYSYLRCANGNESAVYIKLEETGQYWAWSSVSGKAGFMDTAPANCNFNPNSEPTSNKSDVKRVEPEVEDYKGAKIYSELIYDWQGEKWAFRFSTRGNFAVMSFGTSDQSIKDVFDFDKNSGNTLAKEARWQEQFARAPKNIGAVTYVVPENIMGFVDYLTTKEPTYKSYTNDDWLTIARGYLKSLKSVGTTTTQDGKTLISNSFVNIQKLGDDENKKVEDALDRVLSGKGVSSRQNQTKDSMRKSDVGQLASALQAYYTSPGNGKYPDKLDVLVTNGDLKYVPKDPTTSEDYGYLKCTNNAEVALYAKLEDTGTYWVWSSVSGVAKDTKVSSPPASCNVYGVKSGFNWRNFLPFNTTH